MDYEYGQDATCIDPMVVPIWTFIKSQLDKFGDNYNQKVVNRNRENGKKGGRPKKPNTTQRNPENPVGKKETQKTPKKNINKNKNINDTKTEFSNSLQPYLEKYGKDMLNDFFLYWTEKSPNGRKMRFEKEKVFDPSRRLSTWHSRSDSSKNDSNELSIKDQMKNRNR